MSDQKKKKITNLDEALELFVKSTPEFLKTQLQWLCPVLVSLPTPDTISPARTEEIFIALHTILFNYPNLWTFAQHFFLPEYPPFKTLLNLSDEPKTKHPRLDYDPEERITELVEACYGFSKIRPFFKTVWNWTQLLEIIGQERFSDKNKFLLIECIALNCDLTSKEKERLALEVLPSEEDLDQLKFQFLLQIESESPVDIIPVSRKRLMTKSLDRIAFVQNVPLKREAEIGVGTNDIQLPESRDELLKNLALSIAKEEPVIITGPSGSGKTTLVEYCVQLSGKKEFENFHRIQISDETDSRTLIGSYTCSSTPGVFHWKEGLLAQSLKAGHWLLIEDLDQATDDVLAIVLSFVETRELYVPSKKEVVKPSPGFQLFMTKSEREVKWHLGSKEISCPSYTDEEMQFIAKKLFPSLIHAVEKICEVIKFFEKEHRVQQSRSLNLRDLLFWCQRCQFRSDINNSSLTREILFEEGLHVFANHLTNLNDQKFRGEMISRVFQVDNPDFHVETREVLVEMNENFLQVGNIRFPIADASSRLDLSNHSFCLTRQARNLMDFLAGSVSVNQPCLLVGETGVGKTSVIQYLAQVLGKKLHVVNVCENSESSDLFGAFKPVDISVHCKTLLRKFENLTNTSFTTNQTQFLSKMYQLLNEKRWLDLLKLILMVTGKAMKNKNYNRVWNEVKEDTEGAMNILDAHTANMFSFVRGVFSDAIDNGDWVLLDEVNLAEKEVLTSICALFNKSSALMLHDGKNTVIRKHPDFRLFCCMNPSTDVGKKDLPQNFRSNFVEFFVSEPENDKDLQMIVGRYLKKLSLPPALLYKVVKFYRNIKALSKKHLNDGTGKIPSFSLRTLCRSLKIASQNPCLNVERSLIEALSICFLTELDRDSYGLVLALIYKHICNAGKIPSGLVHNTSSSNHVQIEGYNIRLGDHEPKIDSKYILTDTVRCNLKDVIRIVAFSQYPILLQGETSVGKTSLIKYIAEASGNRLVRINNHEHTDIQEYIGCYGSDEKGNFCFKEGVLAQAMRKGFWLILDELNLASTEILEALNRVLDDNRELFISETQARIVAHPNFRVFATQNPAGGHYGGRKVLSRAFRNRFIEIHFDELKPKELEEVIEKKCAIPSKLSKMIVRVMCELQKIRKASETFRGKKGFITLRDLFRWASRYQNISDYKLWLECMAEEGFLVLATRCRKSDEVDIIKNMIEKIFKLKLPGDMFSLESPAHVLKEEMEVIKRLEVDLALTTTTVRMMSLLLHSFKNREPVLLIGNTGLGKTSVCQAIADHLKREMYYLSCHLNTDASDFLGSLRPCRSKESNQLFEWQDGPLVKAMQEGGIFLLDEISLADDSVIERVNSALEEGRTMVLPEKPNPSGTNEVFEIEASENFVMCATMNPGGDFGKKELSPALRNRFLEIWCPSHATQEDLKITLKHLLGRDSKVNEELIDLMVEYIGMANDFLRPNSFLSFRDIRTWTNFITAKSHQLDPVCAIVHGVCLILLDGLETLDTFGNLPKIKEMQTISFNFFNERTQRHQHCDCLKWIMNHGQAQVKLLRDKLEVGPFSFPISPGNSFFNNKLVLDAPTIKRNLFKVVRGIQIGKPVLLEGSPGVGKSALVQALATCSGNQLVRINLSDQTDIADLFGSDLPSADESLGKFSWQDGPFLSAMKTGQWILLDELNLATQSVLEGLNACLDHRGEIFLPELGKTFKVKNSKIFATQNPYKDGSGRKGLPKSFMNRFIKVYMSSLQQEDTVMICKRKQPRLPGGIIKKLANCLDDMNEMLRSKSTFGGPWIFNLRDLQRWCDGIVQDRTCIPKKLEKMARLLLVSRLRTDEDRADALEVLNRHFPQNNFKLDVVKDLTDKYLEPGFCLFLDHSVRIGEASFTRECNPLPITNKNLRLLHEQFPYLEQIIHCMENKWIPILVGDQGTGKTSMIQVLANLKGAKFTSITMNPLTDASEILGSFEQTDFHTAVNECKESIVNLEMALASATGMNVKERLLMMDAFERNFRKEEDKLQVLENMFDRLEAIDTVVPLEDSQRITDLRKQTQITLLETKLKFQRMQLGEDQVRFQWVDSPLVDAIVNGKWLLIENANFCPASVLDRLNGLFEPEGNLVLGEAGCSDGKLRTIEPHQDFKIFLTMNPKFGELSAAMRNRCVEIFIKPQPEIKIDSQPKIKELCRFSDDYLMVYQIRSLQNYFKDDLKMIARSFFKISSHSEWKKKIFLLTIAMKLSRSSVKNLCMVFKDFFRGGPWADERFYHNIAQEEQMSIVGQLVEPMDYVPQASYNNKFVSLELFLNSPKNVPMTAKSAENAEHLSIVDSDIAYAFRRFKDALERFKINNKSLLEIFYIMLCLTEIRKAYTLDTLEEAERKFNTLCVILRKYFDQCHFKDIHEILMPQFLLDKREENGSLEMQDFTRTISVWPALKEKKNCIEFKKFLKLSSELSPYADCPKDVYEERLGRSFEFSNFQFNVSGLEWIKLLLGDILVNHENFLNNVFDLDDGYDSSPFYPIAVHSMLKYCDVTRHCFKSSIALNLHERCKKHVWNFFLSSAEVEIPTEQLDVAQLFHIIFHPQNYTKLFQLRNFHRVKETFGLTSVMLRENHWLFQSVHLQTPSLMQDVSKDQMTTILNALTMNDNGFRRTLVQCLIMISQLLDFPKELKTMAGSILELVNNKKDNDGGFHILCGLFYFKLALLCNVDTKELMEEEIRLSKKESEFCQQSMVGDRMCYFLTSDTNLDHKPIVQHPLHRMMEELIKMNNAKEMEIKKKIPERVENFSMLKQTLKQWHKSIMSPQFVQGICVKLRQEGQWNEEFADVLHVWETNILRAISDSEEKFSSFQEIWILFSMGMTEVLDGVKLLKRKYIFDQCPEKIQTHSKLQKLTRKGHNPDEFSDFLRPFDQKHHFLNLYRDVLKNTRYLVDKQCHMLPQHQQAMKLVLEMNAEKDEKLHNISSLVPTLLSTQTDVETRLLSQFEDNPLLLDVTRSIDKIMEHSIGDPKLEFQLSLENLLDKIGHWNKAAHSQIKVASDFLEQFLKSWRRSDLEELKKTTDLCLEIIQKKSFDRLEKLYEFCLNISNSDDSNLKKASWIYGTIILFTQSSNITELGMNLEGLNVLANWFVQRGNNALATLVRVAISFVKLHHSELGKLREQERKKAEKLSSDLFKVLVVRRDLTCLKISREKKKLESDIAKALSTEVPRQEMSPDLEFSFSPVKLDEIKKDLLDFDGIQTHTFKSSDGKVLGNTKEMVLKAKSHLQTARKFVEEMKLKFEEELDTDSLKSFIKTLSIGEANKAKDRYRMKKGLESVFKDLHSQGISFLFGNRFDVSSSNMVPKCSDKLLDDANVLKCLAQYDLMSSTLRKPEKQADKNFSERASGFSSHLILLILEMKSRAFDIDECTQNFVRNLNEIKSYEETKIKMRLERISRVCDDLGESDIFSGLRQSISALKSKPGQHEVSKCLEEIFRICQEYSKLKSIFATDCGEVYGKICHLKTLLLNIEKKEVVALKNHNEIELENFRHKHLQHLTKVLNSVVQVKNELTKEFREQNFKQVADEFVHFSKQVGFKERLAEAQSLLSYLNLVNRQPNEFCIEQILEEGVGIQRVYLESSMLLSNLLNQWLTSLCHYTFLLMKTCELFAGKKYAKDDDENEDDQEGEGKDSGKASDGCGLGDGEGEKSTLEGVESEDLFENQEKKNDGEEEEESSDKTEKKKDDEFVDYSEDLDTEAQDMDDNSGNEESDSDDQEEDKDKAEDMEEGTAEEDEKQTNEDLLNPEDWDANPEEEEEKDPKEAKDEKSDALTEKKNDKKDADDEDQNNQDLLQDPETEKRERQPDNEENEEENPDPNMKDELHNQEHKEEEVEDLDMNEDVDMDENDNDSASDNEHQEDEIERLPDFKDDEKLEDEEEKNSAENKEDVDEAQKETNDQSTKSKNDGGNTKDSDEQDEEEEHEDSNEDKKKSDNFDAKSQEIGRAELEDEMSEKDPTNEMMPDKEDIQEEEKDKGAEESQMECEEMAKTEDREVISSKDTTDVDKSETFAHLKAKDDLEKATTAMDSVSFENLDKMKLKIDQDEEMKDQEEDGKKNREDNKNALDQPLDTRVREDLELVPLNLISRGSHSFHNTDLNYEREAKGPNFKGRTDQVLIDTEMSHGSEHTTEWMRLCAVTLEKSQYLTEQLRLIIEPTKITRLRGDYSSGKRLNMKRIIPYIASNFRKDKIWLRRTRPAKRDCQIGIAVDDSSSMCDNKVKEMCFESLATICTAMSTLEVGQVGVIKFGGEASVVSPLKDNFSSTDGANILSKFGFDQTKTELLKLLNLTHSFFTKKDDNPLSKLLIILSDGKGVLNEGKKQMLEAVREARLKGIFIVYVILESQENRESVLDIKMATFDKDNKLTMESYMDSFPFPFYMILRNIDNLPFILSDALRQWFELVNDS